MQKLLPKIKINWNRVFRDSLRAFTEEEHRAAQQWNSCAVNENHPKLARKLHKAAEDFKDYEPRGNGPAARIERAMTKLGVLFPLLVSEDKFEEARQVYNSMRLLMGKKPVNFYF